MFVKNHPNDYGVPLPACYHGYKGRLSIIKETYIINLSKLVRFHIYGRATSPFVIGSLSDYAKFPKGQLSNTLETTK